MKRDTDSVTSDPRIATFLWLWPLGIFFHSLNFISRNGLENYATMYVEAEWTPGIFLPLYPHLILCWVLWLETAVYLVLGERKRLAAWIFAFLSVLHFLHLMHKVSNHVLLIMIPIFLLLAFPRLPENKSDIPSLVRSLRLLVTITYFFAILHKLTPVYMSATESPAVFLLRDLSQNVGWPGLRPIIQLAPHAGLLFELGIIIGLNVKRFRALAVYLGLIFHGVLIAGAGAADYSAVMLALYPVFLDKDELVQTRALVQRFTWKRGILSIVLAFCYVTPCFFPLGSFGSEAVNNSQGYIGYPFVLAFVSFTVYIMLSLLPWLQGKLRLGEPESSPWQGRETAYLAIFSALYAINCSAPYLGLKDVYSQAMFSGLDTDARNHYFIPRIELFRNDDYLDVVSLEVAGAFPRSIRKQARPFYTMRNFSKKFYIHSNYLASITEEACKHPELVPISLTYQVPGVEQLYEFHDVCSDSEALPSSYPLNIYRHKERKYRYARGHAR